MRALIGSDLDAPSFNSPSPARTPRLLPAPTQPLPDGVLLEVARRGLAVLLVRCGPAVGAEYRIPCRTCWGHTLRIREQRARPLVYSARARAGSSSIAVHMGPGG